MVQKKRGNRLSLSRRELLQAGSLAAASLALPGVGLGKGILGDARLARFACNVESWWTDLPFMERFERAAKAGFDAVEFWHIDQPGRDVDAIATTCKALGLEIIQFTGWGSPSLADERNHAKFMDRIREALDVAAALDAPMFTIVGHQSIDGLDQETSLANLERALARAAPLLEEAQRVAILEPFNPVDHQGHFLNGSQDALAVCRSIDSPAVKLNWDLYHMQLSEGNLIASLRGGIDQVAYVQIADVPGRHQPGTGELNYTRIFAALDDIGYDGYIGLECWPDAGDAERAIADLIATVESKVDT